LAFVRISSLASSNPLTNLSDERFLSINELYMTLNSILSGEHSPDDGVNDQFRQSYHQYDDKYSSGFECNESSLGVLQCSRQSFPSISPQICSNMFYKISFPIFTDFSSRTF